MHATEKRPRRSRAEVLHAAENSTRHVQSFAVSTESASRSSTRFRLLELNSRDARVEQNYEKASHNKLKQTGKRARPDESYFHPTDDFEKTVYSFDTLAQRCANWLS